MYMFDYPHEVTDIVQNAEGDIQISDIKSKKLFDLWMKLAKIIKPQNTKENSSLLEQIKINKLSNSLFDDNKSKRYTKNHSSNINNDESEFPKIRPTSPNISVQKSSLKLNEANKEVSENLDQIFREKCYRIADKIKEKIEINRRNRLQLFTFNPNKIRVKSPVISRARKLINENGFHKIYQLGHKFNL